MKMYKAFASYTVTCVAMFDAESDEQAWEIASELDGGHFEPAEACDDWRVDYIEEVKNEDKISR